MSKSFKDWIEKCPSDFTIITVNGRDAYLFGKSTDLVIDVKTKDESKFKFVQDCA